MGGMMAPELGSGLWPAWMARVAKLQRLRTQFMQACRRDTVDLKALLGLPGRQLVEQPKRHSLRKIYRVKARVQVEPRDNVQNPVKPAARGKVDICCVERLHLAAPFDPREHPGLRQLR